MTEQVPAESLASFPKEERKQHIKRFNEARRLVHRRLRSMERFRYEVHYEAGVSLKVTDTFDRADELDGLQHKLNVANAILRDAIEALTRGELELILSDVIHTEVLNGAPHPIPT